MRSSRRRVFVGGGGSSLSRDMRRSNSRTRSLTPGERGLSPVNTRGGTTAAGSSDGGSGGPGVVGAGGGGDGKDGSGGGTSDELSVRVELYEGSPRTYSARNGLGPDDDPDGVRPVPATPNSPSSVKGFVRAVNCESRVASRWTMSIVPPTRSSVSVLAVCSEDADRPCDISR